jgi:hypothetical protein
MPGWVRVRHSAIPVSLHGTWRSSAQQCGKTEAAIVLAKNSYSAAPARCPRSSNRPAYTGPFIQRICVARPTTEANSA